MNRKLGVISFCVLTFVVGILTAKLSILPRHEATAAQETRSRQEKIEFMKSQVEELPNHRLEDRPRLAYENYERAIQLAHDGYVDKYSIDAAMNALNYKAIPRTRLLDDFENLKKVLDGKDEILTDITNLVDAVKRRK